MKPIQQETAEQLSALIDERKIITNKLIKNLNKLIKIMEPEGFYMIYVEGQNSPTRKHLTYQDAKEEAERLARLTHRKTYILGTIECFEVNDIIKTKCNVHELPF